MARERRSTGNITLTIPAGSRQTAIQPDETRIYLAIYNTGANPGRVAFDQQAGENIGVPLAAGGTIVFSNANSVTYSYVDVYSTAGTDFTFITVTKVPE